MGRKTYFLLAGIPFVLVGLAHALRVYASHDRGSAVPKRVSWIALVVRRSVRV
jgi:hypothetical protein